MVDQADGVKQVKKRRITQKDWDKVAEFVKSELSRRQNDSFRKKHERVWKEVDRQITMEPVEATKKDPGDKGDWHNAIELGELARASEIITADAMRLTFPHNRMWFEAHAELPANLNTNTGESDPEDQKQMDGAIRALMTQQHTDFGFKERVNLSVHEALHHGGFVVEVDEETALRINDGSGIQATKSPVWKPHSMWNSYPDPSPSAIGTNTFYNGSMLIKEYVPLYQLREMAIGDGWMSSQIPKIKKRTNKNKDVETEDIELVKYFGDVVIKRQDGDILLPNSETILANDTIIFWAPSKLPFPRIIYNGYEKMDVRDPYYVSPLIKTAPLHKMASQLANKVLDNIDLWVEPPIVYDGLDPNFVQNGGPVISPGAKSATKGLANFKEIKIGDPVTGLSALTFILDQVRQSTSVDANRAGAGASADLTATEARQQARRGEVRVVDFVDKLECSLKAFLYMQHLFNRRGLERYSFYNPEMDAPDFNWMNRDDLPENVHFEVVGAKGILGEEERAQKMMGVTMMAAQNELFAPLLKPAELLKEAYMDAGAKNPERFIQQPKPELDTLVEKIQEEAQQIISGYEKQIFELQKDLAIRQAVNDARVVEAQTKAQIQASVSEYKAELQGQLDVLRTQMEIIKSQPPEVNFNSEEEVVRNVIQSIKDIEDIVEAQFRSIDERTASLEERSQAASDKIEGLLERASKPMPDKIREIKKLLKEMRDEA